MAAKDVPLGEYRWIWQVTRPYHGRVYLLCVLSTAMTLASLAMAVLLRDLINAAVTLDSSLVMRLAIAMCVVGFGEIALIIVNRTIRETTTYRIVQHLQERLFSNLLNKDYTYVSEKHSAEWMNRMISDIDGIALALTSMVPGLLGVALNLAGASYLIFQIAPMFLVLVAFGGLALVGLNYLLRNQLKQRERMLREAIGVKNVYVTEHLSKLLIVKSFSRETLIEREAQGKFDEMTRTKIAKMRVAVLKDGLQNLAMRLAYLVVLIYCAAKILRGQITYGSAVMFMRLMNQISMPLMDVSTYLSQVYDAAVCAERLQEVEGYPNDPDGPVKDDEEIRHFYDNDFADISLVDAAFSYRSQDEDYDQSLPTVFEHVNLCIPKKSCIAITGITGSGKSTLFKLLMSFYRLQLGRKLVRTTSGEELDLDAGFRRLFAYVPQGNQLMVGSIRDMVTFGEKRTDDTDERVWEALEEACAREFVEALPYGLDTVVKERGAGLSEGQLQRIAVARSLYTGRPILLLDEATSALDEATELELLSHLHEMTDRTTLFVTHRPNALSICDHEIHINGTEVLMRELG